MGDPSPRRVVTRRSPASDAATALLSALVREGVRDVVVAPGSRSQALALAAAELERVGAIRLHVRIDERGAGFLALGTAVESGRPAVVVTTSGTAVANLHPAVLEAHHAGVPLIVCSADRPVELRGIRSNQTTVQPGIFAGAVRLERDVAAPDGAPGEADAARASPARPSTRRSAATPPAIPCRTPARVRCTQPPVPRAAVGRGRPRRPPRASGRGERAVLDAEDANAAAVARTVIEAGPRTLVVAGRGAGPSPRSSRAPAAGRSSPRSRAARTSVRTSSWPTASCCASPGSATPSSASSCSGIRRSRARCPRSCSATASSRSSSRRGGASGTTPAHGAPLRARGARRRPRADARGARVGRPLGAGEPHAPRRGAAAVASVRDGIDETGHVSDFAAQREYMRAQLAVVRAR
jgi:2-succinyl-5-enolpyruvyl-6-hydroxy-3-cyclohexene-1-carboxylate synthase